MDQAVSPMELLKEEMENDEIALRINAIHRLRIVATILGPEGIKNQLLPYLDQLIKKEEDEVLFAIAEELGSLGSLLPGN
jgi:serine/threonine-protein phosphatase 2A regulatory subunit A